MRAKPACGPLAATFQMPILLIEMQKYNNKTGRQNKLAKLLLGLSFHCTGKLRAGGPKGRQNSPGFAAPEPGFGAPKPGFENPEPGFGNAKPGFGNALF